MKKPTISIAIPAYFAEDNIEKLLRSLVLQSQKNIRISEILVYSDGCTDKTVENARKVRDVRIKVIDAKKRGGMAKGMLYMMTHFKGDLFLLLNDDIYIQDKSMVDKIAKPYVQGKNIGMVGGNPQPFAPLSFIEKCLIVPFHAYSRFRYTYKGGNTKYTCDGKLLLLSRDFIQSIHFPRNLKDMGCVDIFLYLSCINEGFKYRFAKNAIVKFRYPNSLRDYTKWVIRNNSNIYLLQKHFGKLVQEEYSLPRSIVLKSLAVQFLNTPIESTFIFFIGQYCNMKAKSLGREFDPMWDPVGSTKQNIRYA